MAFNKIHPLALGLTAGVLSGLAAFFVSLSAFIFYTGKPFVGMMGTMYVSYNPSLMNCALAGVGTAINVFIGAYVAAWVYNFLVERLP